MDWMWRRNLGCIRSGVISKAGIFGKNRFYNCIYGKIVRLIKSKDIWNKSMKIILSRKGCDSDFGGIPGIILPDGRIIYIPIPGDDFETITYQEVSARNGLGNLSDIIGQVSPYMKMYGNKIPINSETKCHLDPDLDYELYPRKRGWRGSFGQADAAQKVLENAGVTVGDLFLFFGWFRYTYYDNGRLRYCKEQGVHMIFGWMQIDQMIYTHKASIPEWLLYHPHSIQRRIPRPSNCIFVGRNSATWNDRIRGYGIFNKVDDSLILTKQGMSRSRWQLPECFRNISITYHKPTSWKDGYFQSACRGQEFVFEESKIVEEWACNLIEKNENRIM